MAFSSEQIRAAKAKRENKNTKVYYKNSTVSPVLLKVIGVSLIVAPLAGFFAWAVITFKSVTP